MSEKIQNNQEHGAKEHEALEQQGQERKEQLLEQLENRSEKAAELGHEAAQKEAEKLAKSVETEKTTEKQTEKAEKSHDKQKRTRKTLDASFDKTMDVTRASMSAPSRAFSKLIHVKAIEKTSEAIGSTVARPNAILSGSLLALLLTAGIYLWAKEAGYALSGFETIAAFIIGWLIGIMFDFFRIMLTGKR